MHPAWCDDIDVPHQDVQGMIMSKSHPEHAASLSAECRLQIRSCCVNLEVPYLLSAFIGCCSCNFSV